MRMHAAKRIAEEMKQKRPNGFLFSGSKENIPQMPVAASMNAKWDRSVREDSSKSLNVNAVK